MLHEDLVSLEEMGYLPFSHAGRALWRRLVSTTIRRVELDSGVRAGISASESQRLKDLEREKKALRRANEILKLASAFFAQAGQGRRLKS